MRIQIKLSEKAYIKDPDSTELGRKIITNSILLIDQIGFESFTFKKLSAKIKSTEASIYRYFENKHKLLIYLISWYWNWTEYRLSLSLANIESADERLKRSLSLLTTEVTEDGKFEHINEAKLQRIVIEESSKAYLNKAVDDVNKDGAFADYKRIVANVASIILEINPKYKYPHMLISAVIEGAHHERYFAKHLPRLTDSVKGEDSIECFFLDMVTKTIKN